MLVFCGYTGCVGTSVSSARCLFLCSPWGAAVGVGSSAHTIRGVRNEFRKVGKFHTPPELAQLLASLVPDNPRDVYDPTCGAGSLLSQFPAITPKFGQDIDQDALADAGAVLENFHGYLGDVLTEPHWLDRRFHAIVANPPFSIKWEPVTDERFTSLPTIPTASRADMAFLAHIIHMLADDGVAAVMQFPGVCYRGGREATLRKYWVERNIIDRVIHIPGGTFTDTSISTVVWVIKKNRTTSDSITMENRENGLTGEILISEIRANDYTLTPSTYLAVEIEEEPVDPVALQAAARRGAIRRVLQDMAIDSQVCALEGWDFEEYRSQLIDAIRSFEPRPVKPMSVEELAALMAATVAVPVVPSLEKPQQEELFSL